MGNGVTSFMLHAVNEFLYRYRGQACFCFMLAVCAFNAFVVVPSLLVRTDLPLLPDALFDVIPHVPAVGVWTDALVYGVIVFYTLATWRHQRSLFAYAYFLGSFMALARSACIVLNPSMPPLGLADELTLAFHATEPGMFFSGHAACSFMVYLLYPGRQKWLLAISLLASFGLIMSRSHYSIDVVGGYAICYCIYRAAELYARPWFFRDESAG